MIFGLIMAFVVVGVVFEIWFDAHTHDRKPRLSHTTMPPPLEAVLSHGNFLLEPQEDPAIWDLDSGYKPVEVNAGIQAALWALNTGSTAAMFAAVTSQAKTFPMDVQMASMDPAGGEPPPFDSDAQKKLDIHHLQHLRRSARNSVFLAETAPKAPQRNDTVRSGNGD